MGEVLGTGDGGAQLKLSVGRKPCTLLRPRSSL